LATRLTCRRPSRAAGFTLLEIIVVLLIIGVVTSFAVLGVRQGSGALEQEGQRLLALLRLTRDEAVLNAEPLGLGFTRSDYLFLQRRLVDEATYEWRPVQDDATLRRRDLEGQGIALELTVQGIAVALPAGGATPAPQVLLHPSGWVTPFELRLRPLGADHGAALLLRTATDGRIELVTP
jgi:general secretion pathway protein H